MELFPSQVKTVFIIVELRWPIFKYFLERLGILRGHTRISALNYLDTLTDRFSLQWQKVSLDKWSLQHFLHHYLLHVQMC